MAYQITEDCTSCDACLDVCPNGAIHKNKKTGIFTIDAGACTECEGHYDAPQCETVCLLGACVPV